jgi:hypothetical protein
MQARGKKTYLPRNIVKVLPACGRSTYPPRNMFKDMPTRGSRTNQTRNIFRVIHARGRRTYLPRITKYCRLVVGHTSEYFQTYRLVVGRHTCRGILSVLLVRRRMSYSPPNILNDMNLVVGRHTCLVIISKSAASWLEDLTASEYFQRHAGSW